MMPRKRREKMERTFARPAGQSLVLFLRLIPLTRILVNIPAGLAKMKVVRFIVLTTIGLLLYHTGFLWFAYEVRRPGSALASARTQFQDAYASPAMDFVAANAIVTGLVVLVVGSVLSVRASRAMLRDPEEASGSLIGWLTTMVLLLGGLVLGVAAYLDPGFVVALAALRGVDIEDLARRLGASVLQLLLVSAVVMAAVGVVLRALTSVAVSHRRHFDREQRLLRDPERRRKALDDPFRDAGRGPDDPLPSRRAR
jgi:hypothetical protein